MRRLEQHLLSQEQDARQPRLAVEEADGHANTKTQERAEGAAKAVQAMRGDSCTPEQKVQDGPKTSITFGVEAELPDFPCREGVLVEDGTTAPKSCLPSLEMHITTAAGGLVPTGKTSATETNFNQPPLRFCSTEETDLEANCKKTSTPYVSYDSSAFQDSNLLAAPYCQRVVEIKFRQNRTFDPGGPFLGSWRALVCGEAVRDGGSWCRAAAFYRRRFAGSLKLDQTGTDVAQEIVKPARAAQGDKSEERRSRRQRRLEVIGRGVIGCWGTLWSEERLRASSLTATSRRGLLFS